MARRKKPENETEKELKQRQMFETIANNATRSEKTSWNRKMDNMVKLLAKLRPIQQQIIDLEVQKLPIMDEVDALRQEMVKECIHPYDSLVEKDNYIECKFCYKRLGLPVINDNKEDS